MAVKIVGGSKPHRIVTGLYSFDRAFVNNDNDLGAVVGIGYEIFGLNSTGKSTFAYSLASILARETEGDIALCDFEGFDADFLSKVAETNGFSGKIYIVSEEDDEQQLDKLLGLMDTKCSVGILDSIGAIAPMGEIKGEIGESNMGKRAFLVAQFSRKGLKLFRFKKDKTILMINHWVPKLGGYGYDTPGGEAKKYITSIRIKLQRKETFPDMSYALVGTVVKNRWGYADRQFHVFMLAGYGLHAGMTALWDCVMLKLVKRTKVGITLDKENLGKLGSFAKAAKLGQSEVFEPFYKLLEGQHGKDDTEDTDGNGVDDSSDDSSSEKDIYVAD